MSELLGLPLALAQERLGDAPHTVVTLKNRFREDIQPDSLRVVRVRCESCGEIQLTVAEFFTASQS